jgi:carbon storage regulator
MLVLTRKYQEKIRIGENITITVLRTKGKAVRLGIEAPADVPVIRGELAFEPTERTLDASDDVCEEAEAAPRRRTACRDSNSDSQWTAEPPHRAETVSLQRVPRDKVAGILPQLVADGRPLRAMMNQR